MKMIQYFQNEYGVSQPGDVRWSHAVNSGEKFDRFINKDGIMCMECDIRIAPNGVAVAAHPPERTSDLGFEMITIAMRKSRQVLKLDFKDPEILERCLRQLHMTPLSQPVLLNADILQGDGANISKFSDVGFLALCKMWYPQGILSVGWTTIATSKTGYTKENVDLMLSLVDGIDDEITFPVRACLLTVGDSWNQLQRLLDRPDRTLTVWNNEPVDPYLQRWIQKNTDRAKTYYDFIDPVTKDPMILW